MSHTCSALILHCMDFRFGSALKQWMEKRRLLNDCDMVALAGAAKNLVNPASQEGQIVLNQLNISVRLHTIQKVILMNHLDCGAYGGRAAFDSDEAERQQHEGDLAKAAAVVQAKFSNLTIEQWIATIDTDGVVGFKQIN